MFWKPGEKGNWKFFVLYLESCVDNAGLCWEGPRTFVEIELFDEGSEGSEGKGPKKEACRLSRCSESGRQEPYTPPRCLPLLTQQAHLSSKHKED